MKPAVGIRTHEAVLKNLKPEGVILLAEAKAHIQRPHLHESGLCGDQGEPSAVPQPSSVAVIISSLVEIPELLASSTRQSLKAFRGGSAAGKTAPTGSKASP